MKKLIYFTISVFLVIGAFLIFIDNPKTALADWYNTGGTWSNRKKITITAQSGAGTNYQVKLKIGETSGATGEDFDLGGLVQSDFDDLCFTASDGTTELSYWIEELTGTTPNQLAVVWVKVSADLSSSNQDIYVYYGNASAPSASNGTNTFLFFDDFSGTSLDLDKWTVYNVDSTTLSGGILSTSATNKDPSKIIADENGAGQTGDNVAMRAKFRITGGQHADQRMGLSVKTSLVDGLGLNYVLHDFANKNKHQFLDDSLMWGTDNGGTFLTNTWYTEEIYYDGTNVWGRFDDGTWYSWARGGRSGYMALNTGGYMETVSGDWDFALIRKIVATEPAYSAAGAQENKPNLPGSSSGTIKAPNKTGLVGHWKFDEGAGVKATDSSGNNNTGSITGATWTSGKLGRALSFNGVSDYMLVSNSDVLDFTSAYTISVWVNPTINDSYNPIMIRGNADVDDIEIYDSAEGQGLTIAHNRGIGGTFEYVANNSSLGVSGAGGWGSLTSNIWTFLTITYNSGTIKVYYNGVQQGSTVTGMIAPLDSNVKWQVGVVEHSAFNGQTDKIFDGKMDDLRIYNRALTDAEIKALYQAGEARIKTGASNNGLVGHWKFDEGAGVKATDSSGQNNIGSITGATWVDGKLGKALSFSGSSQYVSAPHSASLTPTGDYTITAWIKTSSTAAEQSVVTKFDASGNYPGYLCSVGRNDGSTGSTFGSSGSFYSVGFWTGDFSTSWLVSSTSVNDNKWHFITCRLSGTTASISVDGSQIASAERAPNRSNTGTFDVGRRKDFGGYFPGLIDDVRVYNRALTAAEVKSLYQAGEVVVK